MKCPRCQSSNVVDPFEMDGYADGKYQREGLWWLVCRDCGRTSRVENPREEQAVSICSASPSLLEGKGTT